jgi:hypothetical protein
MKRRPNMSDDELRIWFFNQKTISENHCWEWTGVRIKDGYGMLSVKGKRFLAHRYSLMLHLNKSIDRNIEVRHRCHNPSCFNPEHLQEGSHQDNMNDMVLDNRQAKGEKLVSRLRGIIHEKGRGEGNGRSKLTNSQVLEIRQLSSTMSQRDIAKLYSVSKTTVRGILSRTTWKNI